MSSVLGCIRMNKWVPGPLKLGPTSTKGATTAQDRKEAREMAVQRTPEARGDWAVPCQMTCLDPSANPWPPCALPSSLGMCFSPPVQSPHSQSVSFILWQHPTSSWCHNSSLVTKKWDLQKGNGAGCWIKEEDLLHRGGGRWIRFLLQRGAWSYGPPVGAIHSIKP